ncbi:MAG: nuclear transport factor 2 family protein [Microthrixaceae bacterium]
MNAGAPSAPDEVADRLELLELQAAYGFIIDDRDWNGLSRVFTPDGVFDVSDLELGVHSGLDGIGAGLAQMKHPIAHHCTNIVISLDPDGRRAKMKSKYIVPTTAGKTVTGEYHDDALRTDGGWRIEVRRVIRRRPRPDSF